ncbi:MAG: hypothetical protein Q9227_006942 [Pyrenula ochraceoflavens]
MTKTFADDEIYDPYFRHDNAAHRRTKITKSALPPIPPFNPNQRPAAFPSKDWLADNPDYVADPPPSPESLDGSYHESGIPVEQSPCLEPPTSVSSNVSNNPEMEIPSNGAPSSSGPRNATHSADVEDTRVSVGGSDLIKYKRAFDSIVEILSRRPSPDMETSEEEETGNQEQDIQDDIQWSELLTASQARICDNLLITQCTNGTSLQQVLNLNPSELKAALDHCHQRRQQERDYDAVSEAITKEHLRITLDGPGDSTEKDAENPAQLGAPSSNSSSDVLKRITNRFWGEFQKRHPNNYHVYNSEDLEKAQAYLRQLGLNPELAVEDFERPKSPRAQPRKFPNNQGRSTSDVGGQGGFQNTSRNPGANVISPNRQERQHTRHTSTRKPPTARTLKDTSPNTPGSSASAPSPPSADSDFHPRRRGLRDASQRKKTSRLLESEENDASYRGSHASQLGIHHPDQSSSSAQHDPSHDKNHYLGKPGEDSDDAERDLSPSEHTMRPHLGGSGGTEIKRNCEGRAFLCQENSSESNRALDQMRQNMNKRFKYQGAGAREKDMCVSSVPKTYHHLSRHVFVQDKENSLRSITRSEYESALKFPNSIHGTIRDQFSDALNTSPNLYSENRNIDHSADHVEQPTKKRMSRDRSPMAMYTFSDGDENLPTGASRMDTHENRPPSAFQEMETSLKTPRAKPSFRRGRDGKRCQNCRKQKKGCDGNRPCELCTKHNHQCQSEDERDLARGSATLEQSKGAMVKVAQPSAQLPSATNSEVEKLRHVRHEAASPLPPASYPFETNLAKAALQATESSRKLLGLPTTTELDEVPIRNGQDNLASPVVTFQDSVVPQNNVNENRKAPVRPLSKSKPLHTPTQTITNDTRADSAQLRTQQYVTTSKPASTEGTALASVAGGTGSVSQTPHQTRIGTEAVPLGKNSVPYTPPSRTGTMQELPRSSSKHDLSDSSIEGWQSESIAAAKELKEKGTPFHTQKSIPKQPAKKAKLTKHGDPIPIQGLQTIPGQRSRKNALSNGPKARLDEQGLHNGMGFGTPNAKLDLRTDVAEKGAISALGSSDTMEGLADDESSRSKTVPKIGNGTRNKLAKNSKKSSEPAEANHTARNSNRDRPEKIALHQDDGGTIHVEPRQLNSYRNASTPGVTAPTAKLPRQPNGVVVYPVDKAVSPCIPEPSPPGGENFQNEPNAGSESHVRKGALKQKEIGVAPTPGAVKKRGRPPKKNGTPAPQSRSAMNTAAVAEAARMEATNPDGEQQQEEEAPRKKKKLPPGSTLPASALALRTGRSRAKANAVKRSHEAAEQVVENGNPKAKQKKRLTA